MRKTWQNTTLVWREPSSWLGTLSKWIAPYLTEMGIRELSRLGPLDLYIDDHEWLNVLEKATGCDWEEIRDRLSEDIQLAKVRAYHGCRTTDATSYHTDGILANDPDRLVQDLKKIVLTEPGFERFRGNIDQLLNEFDARERDTGTVFVCLDDRGLIEDCGHYLLYGSEWMQCVLGFSAHSAWRGWGVPTVIEVEFHLDQVSEASRSELAEKLLLEWSGIKVNHRTETQALDFSFWFHHSIPAKWISGHYHPPSVMCPYNHVAYRSPSESCRNCSS